MKILNSQSTERYLTANMTHVAQMSSGKGQTFTRTASRTWSPLHPTTPRHTGDLEHSGIHSIIELKQLLPQHA